MKINFSIELSNDELTNLDLLKVIDSLKSQLIKTASNIENVSNIEKPNNIYTINDFADITKYLTENVKPKDMSIQYGSNITELKRVINSPGKITLFKLLNVLNCELGFTDEHGKIVYKTNSREDMEKYIKNVLSKQHNLSMVAYDNNINYQSLCAYYRKPSLNSMLLIAKLHNLNLSIIS